MGSCSNIRLSKLEHNDFEKCEEFGKLKSRSVLAAVGQGDPGNSLKARVQLTLRVLKALHAGGVDVSVRLCGGHLGSRERLGRLDPGGAPSHTLGRGESEVTTGG